MYIVVTANRLDPAPTVPTPRRIQNLKDFQLPFTEAELLRDMDERKAHADLITNEDYWFEGPEVTYDFMENQD